MPKVLDTYLKALPVFIIILTAIGYLYLFSYYIIFGINIIYYIDISEILLLFINYSVLLITAAAIVSIKTFIIINKSKNDELSNEKETPEEKLKTKNSIKRILLFKNITAIVLIVVGAIYGLAFKEYFTMSVLITLGIIVLLFFKKAANLLTIGRKGNKPEFFLLSFSIIYLLILSLVPLLFQINKAYNVKNYDKEIINTNFSYQEIKIETTKNLKYIGETRNYIFLYNQSKKESIICEKDKITNRKIIKR